jgi:hypothetical protein
MPLIAAVIPTGKGRLCRHAGASRNPVVFSETLASRRRLNDEIPSLWDSSDSLQNFSVFFPGFRGYI